MTYWDKRSQSLEQLTDRRCRVTAGEIEKIYDDALDKLQKDINKIFSTYVHSYGLKPTQAKQLLTQTQTRETRQKMLDTIKQLEAENADPAAVQALRSVLDAPAYAYRISKLEALRAEIYADATVIGLDEIKYHRAVLPDIYQESYYRTLYDLSKEQGVLVPFHKLSQHETAVAIEKYWSPGVEKVAQNYSKRIWGNTTALAENLRDVVTRGILTGTGYTEMIEELTRLIGSAQYQKKIEPDGGTRTVLTGTGAKYRAARLIRTEGNYIHGQARMAAYQEAGIKRYIYRCHLELKTCRRCGELDGEVFLVDEQRVGVNMHPMHPSCRCIEIPWQDKQTLDEKRRVAQVQVNRGELVPSSMTYRDWKRKYVDDVPEMLEAEKNLRKNQKDKSEQKARNPRKSSTVPAPVHVVPKRWLDYLAKQDQTGK